jgi:hypothetical protein
MRKAAWFAAAAAMFVLPAGGVFAQDAKPQPDPQTAQASSASPVPSQAPSQEDSIAAAARKARDQKKEAPKAAKVFDNDSIPTTGGVSTVGSAPATPGDTDANGSANPGGAASPAANDEKTWRDRFATLRHKLDQDQAELGILEREAAVADVQFYKDPLKGMQQDLTRDDINKKTAALAAMKKTIEADKQAISDAEEALRKAGGDSGWAR